MKFLHRLSIMKLETFKSIFEFTLAILVLLTALIGIINFYIGKKIENKNEIQKEKLNFKIANSYKIAENAKKEAAVAIESTVVINERAKKLELELFQQKERAANAEKELYKIKVKFSVRKIPNHVKEKLIIDLKKFNNSSINFLTIGDQEATDYSEEIKNIFFSAKWEIGYYDEVELFTGVSLEKNGGEMYFYEFNDTDKNLLNSVKSIFEKNNIIIKIIKKNTIKDPQLNQADLHLIIGPKLKYFK